jgi:hypothetical protein
MNKATDYIERIQPFGEQLIAIPIIWDKEILEAYFEFKLSDAEWALVVEKYLNNSKNLYDESLWAMTDAVERVMGRL